MRARWMLISLLLTIGLTWSPGASASKNSAVKALKELEEGRKPNDVVQNRFFLKSERFEVAPVFGYVPNNPFVKRYVGGVLVAYHFNETLAAEGAIMYSPDLGETDLKDLTITLVQIAHQGDASVGFQQPVNKMKLGATFAARWAPIYGKINLIGERVLNFDLYGTAGLGLLSMKDSYAVYDEDVPEGAPPVKIRPAEDKATVPFNVGIGFDFFLSQSIALKIDARNYIYGASKPIYDPSQCESDPASCDESRLYDNFIASAGVSIFFPKMKPRLSYF